MVKFISFVAEGKERFGIYRDGAAEGDGGAVDLSTQVAGLTGLRHAIETGRLAELASAAENRPVDYGDGDFTYRIPVPDPEKIICVGVNYPDRNAEYKDGTDLPANMSLFPRFPRSFIGHQGSVVRPFVSDKLDYEGEIVVVIGKQGRHIPEDSAYEHIAALSLCNEGTLRDWVRHAKFNVTQGKNFDASGAMGPWLVPFESPAQIEDIKLCTRVNGEVRQEDRTSRMMFGFRRQIAYISTFTTLVPGDIIVTGTPTGAGARLDPPQFLKPGDTVEVEAEGIGMLSNTVVDEVRPAS